MNVYGINYNITLTAFQILTLCVTLAFAIFVFAVNAWLLNRKKTVHLAELAFHLGRLAKISASELTRKNIRILRIYTAEDLFRQLVMLVFVGSFVFLINYVVSDKFNELVQMYMIAVVEMSAFVFILRIVPFELLIKAKPELKGV